MRLIEKVKDIKALGKTICVLFLLAVFPNGMILQECDARVMQQTKSEHIDIVTNISNEIIAVKKAKLSEIEAKAKFIEIAKKYVALKDVAKFLLKHRFRTLDQNKKTAFIRCVKNLMATRLFSELPKGDSIKMNLIKSKVVSEKHSLITMEYVVDKKYTIVFSIFDTKEGPKIFDVLINDVSASQMVRADIDGKISRDGFDKFLSDFFNMYDK